KSANVGSGGAGTVASAVVLAASGAVVASSVVMSSLDRARATRVSEGTRRMRATLQSGPIGVLRGCSQLHWLLIRADRAPMSRPSLAVSTTVLVHGRPSTAGIPHRWTCG